MVAKQQQRKATSVADWKGGGFDPFLDLPSGKTIKVRPATGFKPLIKAGIIPNSLMSIVMSALNKGEEPDLSAFSKDLSKINEMLELMDAITIFTVVEPEIKSITDVEGDRDPDSLYVDEVAEEDKMFIFQWVTGGTRDLEQFRKEAGSTLDVVQRSKDVASKTKPAPRTRRR